MKKVLLVLLAVTAVSCVDECVEEYNVREIGADRSTQVQVCHNGNTLTINQNALQAHLNHGDTEGPCSTLSDPIFVRPGVVEAECGLDYGDEFRINGRYYRIVY